MVFDPQDHIDRDKERNRFRELVADDPTGRVLTICDAAQNGKSSLLKCLQHLSHTELEVPATLVELDRLTGNDLNAYGLAEKIVDGFLDKPFGADTFTAFERIRQASRQGDRSIFADPGPVSVEGRTTVNHMSGGQAIGVNYHTEHHYHAPAPIGPVGSPTFERWEEEKARKLAVAAFFDDLHRICAEQRLVILLDAWDRCNVDLRNWIKYQLFGKHVLHKNPDERPALLRVVLTARPHHPLHEKHGLRADEFRFLFRTTDDYDATIRSISGLSKWDDAHIRDFLVSIGSPDLEQAYVDVIGLELRTKETPLGRVLTYIKPFVQRESA